MSQQYSAKAINLKHKLLAINFVAIGLSLECLSLD